MRIERCSQRGTEVRLSSQVSPLTAAVTAQVPHALGKLPSLWALFGACGWGVAAAASSGLLLVLKTVLACRKHSIVSTCAYYPCWCRVVK